MALAAYPIQNYDVLVGGERPHHIGRKGWFWAPFTYKKTGTSVHERGCGRFNENDLDLGGGFIFFFCSPLFGEDSHSD